MLQSLAPKRTLEVLAYLEKADAITFSKLCGFAFMIGGPRSAGVSVEGTDAPLTTVSTFPTLSHLESLPPHFTLTLLAATCERDFVVKAPPLLWNSCLDRLSNTRAQ